MSSSGTSTRCPTGRWPAVPSSSCTPTAAVAGPAPSPSGSSSGPSGSRPGTPSPDSSMINLRYHVVSLVAVFLALGLGVIMGSTVIDRVTVDQLRNQLDRVESSVKQTRKENGQLSGRLRVWDQFADQARDQVLRARLQTVPVLIVGVDGIDHGPVDDLRRQLVNAQATFQGTIWLSSKLRLGSQSDTAGLATALGVPAEQPDVLRRLAVTKIAAVLDGSAPDPNPLPALRDAGF